ncbi:SAG-related sequence [Besnoitia besnoiti]|uniref:SAG-related sequence n=1 Tax=Besnoitia besnoiti TaxID=94643 RepID=A0A2A9MG71_BESBE|nr:SAG-related sequence [Besnoitia besnoiti]PFH35271.1 SAG-related sequence [Besnoitia besnoiti]
MFVLDTPARMARSGLARAVCFFLLAAAPCWQRASAAKGTQVQPDCKVQNATTMCNCSDQPSKATREEPVNDATLSESTNILQVQCKQPSAFVPAGTSVCAGTGAEASLTACKASEGGSPKVPISTLLAKIPSSTTAWEASDDTSSLTIPSASFPFVDKDFFVGCSNGDSSSCVVNVTVKARKSLLKENVLTCSYGAESNQPVPKTTLDSTNNSLTVVCGTDGTMPLTAGVPTIYLCKDPETDVCTTVEDVTEVFPGFSKAWWTKQDGQENAAKLTIPKDGFPVEPKTVMFGCSLQVQPPLRKMRRKRTGWMQLSFLHAR